MVDDTCILRSTIKPKILKTKLLRGTLIASIGVFLIAFAGIFLSPAVLSKWGLAIFFSGFGFLAAGLIPYRRLISLEKMPSEITISHKNGVQYFLKGKKLLTIPAHNIDSIGYYENGAKYGICITLRPICQMQIIVHNKSFNFKDFLSENKFKYGCELFFPYFSQNSCKELQSIIQDVDPMPD